MIVSRLYLIGLGGVLALAAGAAPLHASCSVGVYPAPVTDSEVVAFGSSFVIRDHTHPANPGRGHKITEIREFYNHTQCIVTLYKVDGFAGSQHKNQGVILLPGERITKDMWVPWADDWNSPQRLRITVGGTDFFDIWQKGDRLAFRTVAQFNAQTEAERRDLYDAALSVPGTTASGGRRHLHISMTSDGRPYFSLNGVD
jgi:hypothetical protein